MESGPVRCIGIEATERRSPRPYGTRERGSDADPGLRFASSWAIFLASLREAGPVACDSLRALHLIVSLRLIVVRALHPGLFSWRPSEKPGLVPFPILGSLDYAFLRPTDWLP